jgi:hypothetical protein
LIFTSGGAVKVNAIRLITLPLAAFLVATPGISAILNVYQTEAAFQTAVGSSNAVTFNEMSAGPYNNYEGVQISGIQFVGNAFSPSNYDVSIINAGASSWDGQYLRGPGYFNSNSRIRVYLPSNIRFFGSQVMTVSTDSATSNDVQIALSGIAGTWQLTTIASFNSTAFIGFQVDSAVEYIDFIPTSGHNLVLDNFRFAASASQPLDPPTETPDPATFVLTGTGVILIVTTIRKRRPVNP